MASTVTTDPAKAAHGHREGADFPGKNLSTDLWLLCTAGSHRFALPMASVVETMRMLPVEAVSGMSRCKHDKQTGQEQRKAGVSKIER